jgi:hypothetical protein
VNSDYKPTHVCLPSGFSRNFVFGNFIKTCRHIPYRDKIRQKEQML